MSFFLELLQVSLGAREELSQVPTDVEWQQIFNEAQRQAVTGVLVNGLEKLPEHQRPPKVLLLQWIGLVQLNETAYKLHCNRAKELTSLFSMAGFSSCIMKGVGIAQIYPNPNRRQCGDIDIWVNGGRKEIVRWLRERYQTGNVIWHHIDAEIFGDVPTEIHYHPCWLYNPFCNQRLQKWFESQKQLQMVIDKRIGFAYPTVRFNAIYSLVHLYHHLIEEGVGIRHILDYYFVLKALPIEEKKVIEAELNQFGLLRLAGAVMWVLGEACAMKPEYMIVCPNKRDGRFLLDEVLRGGNFGHYRRDDRKRNSLIRYMALVPHFPHEVLWVVPWKMWHRSWMLLHKNG